MVLRTWYLVLDTKTYLYMVLCTSYLVQKKGLLVRAALFMKVDLISSRTHQKLNLHSTWYLQ
jgi:hypothetical protein